MDPVRDDAVSSEEKRTASEGEGSFRIGSRTGKAQSKKGKPSPLDKFFSLFISEDPVKMQRRLLRGVERSLKRMRQKYYSPKSGTALPGLARLFYAFYKILAPARAITSRAEFSNLLKELIIEEFLTKEQSEVMKRLQEETIRKRIKDTSVEKVANEIKKEFRRLVTGFGADSLKKINTIANQLYRFLDLVKFDYYFLLKKFDSNLPESDFTYLPHFEAINGEYVLEDLKDFNEIGLALDSKADWNRVFDILKHYRDIDVISRSQWRKGLAKLLEIRRNGALDLIIKHLSQDPVYQARIVSGEERVVEQYLSRLKAQTEFTIHKIVREVRKEEIQELVRRLFGKTPVPPLRNYSNKANITFGKNLMAGFIHMGRLSYIQAFLQESFKEDMEEVIELLLIKGSWSDRHGARQFTDAVHHLRQIPDRISQLDDDLAEEGELGIELGNLSRKSDRDKSLLPKIRLKLHETNEFAKLIIDDTTANLVGLGNILKAVLEEHGKKKGGSLIINWREIEAASDGRIRQKLIQTYTKIFQFLKLLSLQNQSGQA
jgi:hypothetical protein